MLEKQKNNDEIDEQEIVENVSASESKLAHDDAQTGLGDIKQKLNEIDQEFDAKIEKMKQDEYSKMQSYEDVSIPSKNEIQKEAKELVDQEMAEQKQEYINKFNFDEKMQALDLKEEKIESNLNEGKEKLESQLENNQEHIKAKLIKQGLENSSIMDNSTSQTLIQYEKELQAIIERANRELDEISLKRSIIKNEMTNALNKFDIAYASKLEDKINELNAEYDKKAANAKEANDKIAKLQESVLKKVETSQTNINNNRDYEKAVYLMRQIRDLPREEALKIINDEEVKASIGGWYVALLDFVDRG